MNKKRPSTLMHQIAYIVMKYGTVAKAAKHFKIDKVHLQRLYDGETWMISNSTAKKLGLITHIRYTRAPWRDGE